MQTPLYITGLPLGIRCAVLKNDYVYLADATHIDEVFHFGRKSDDKMYSILQHSVVLDSKIIFTLPGPGEYIIRARGKGYIPAEWTVYVSTAGLALDLLVIEDMIVS